MFISSTYILEVRGNIMSELITFDWIKHPEDPRMLETLEVYFASFKNESITNYAMDLSSEEAYKTYQELLNPFARYMIAKGNEVLIALIEERVVGLAIFTYEKPIQVTSGRKYLSKIFRPLFKLLKYIRWRRLPTFLRTNPTRYQHDKDAITLAILGVSPNEQGKGIGHQLLAKITEVADEKQQAIYLTTALDKTRDLYKSYGFEEKALHQNDTLKVFEMRRPAQVK